MANEMALVPSFHLIPTMRSRWSLMEPTWQIGDWDSFGLHNLPNRETMDLEKRMDSFFQMMHQLEPKTTKRALQRMPSNQHVLNESDGTQKLRLQFDVRQFKPEEIRVQTHDDLLYISARHEEKSKSGVSLQEFQRQCTLPRGMNPEDLTSSLSPEGVLTIEGKIPLEGSIGHGVIPMVGSPPK